MFYLARTKGIDLMFGNSFESSGEEQNDIHWRWKLWSRLKRPNANIKGHKSDFIGIWLWQGFYDTLSCKFNFCVVLEDIKKGSSLLVKFILPTFTSLRNSVGTNFFMLYKKKKEKNGMLYHQTVWSQFKKKPYGDYWNFHVKKVEHYRTFHLVCTHGKHYDHMHASYRGIVYNETFYFILNLRTPFCF